MRLGTHLFVKVPRRDSDFSVFESNSHLLLPVYPLIGRGYPVKCLAQRHNKRSFMLNVKQESCEYQVFKVFWSDSARESNRGLPTFNTKITKFYCLQKLSVLLSWKHELLVKK